MKLTRRMNKIAKVKRNNRGLYDAIRYFLMLCGAVPFVFFLHTTWGHAAMLGYVMTAVFFGVVLIPEYPAFRNPEFWKALVLVIILHSILVSGLVWLDLVIPDINRMPRALYGFGTMVLIAEWWLSARIFSTIQRGGR